MRFPTGRGVVIAAALFISVGWSLFIHREELADRHVVDDDVGGYYYVYYGLADETALPKDLLMQAVRDTGFGRLGGVWIAPRLVMPIEVRLAARFGLRQTLLWKSVALGALVALVAFLAAAAVHGPGPALGLLAVLLPVLSSTDALYGGMPRTFGLLITCLCWLSLVRGSAWGLAACVALSYALYAAMSPLALAFFAVLLLSRLDAGRRVAAALACAALCGAGVWALVHFLPDKIEGIRTIFSFKNALRTGELTLPETLFLNSNEHSPMYRVFSLLMLACALAAGWLLRNRRDLLLAWESQYLLAMAAAFLACLPIDVNFASRQLIHALPLFLCVYPWRAAFSLRRRGDFFRLAAAVLVMFFALWPKISNLHRVDAGKVAAVASLPKDSLIFAHPERSSEISFFSGLAVYSQRDWQHLLCGFRYGDYCDKASQRAAESLGVFYGSSADRVRRFAASSGVTHFVVEERYYADKYFRSNDGNSEFAKASKMESARAGPGEAALLSLAKKLGRRVSPGVWILASSALNGTPALAR